MASQTETFKKWFEDPDISKQYATAEKATGPPASALLHKSGILQHTSNPIYVLDNACGTGLVSSLLHQQLENRARRDAIHLTMGDLSEQMVKAASERATKDGWSNFEAKVVDSQKMDVEDNTFDYVLTNFGYQLMPKSQIALKESIRVTKPGGTIGFVNWIKIGWLPMLQLAVSRLPNANFDAYMPAFNTSTWPEQSWVRSELTSNSLISEVDIMEYTFKTPPFDENPEVANAMIGFILKVVLPSWTEEQRKICEEGGLENELKKAAGEIQEYEWTAMVVVAKKTAA